MMSWTLQLRNSGPLVRVMRCMLAADHHMYAVQTHARAVPVMQQSAAPSGREQVENRLLFYLYLAQHCVPGCFRTVYVGLHGTVTVPCKYRSTSGVTTLPRSARAKQYNIRVDVMQVALDFQ